MHKKHTHTFTTLEAFMTTNNMFLLNKKPTTIYGSTLDHLWTTNQLRNILTSENNCYWSDHLITYLLFNW